MKNPLKPKEQLAVDNFLKQHHTARLLRNFKSWQDFKLDDIIVRYRIDENETEKIDNVSVECTVPKKFKIVHIDELGCPWVKNVNVRSGLGNKLYCLVDSPNYRYQVDPEILDCILIGVKYDPRAQYRSWRQENPNYGGI